VEDFKGDGLAEEGEMVDDPWLDHLLFRGGIIGLFVSGSSQHGKRSPYLLGGELHGAVFMLATYDYRRYLRP